MSFPAIREKVRNGEPLLPLRFVMEPLCAGNIARHAGK